ncbi:MAG: ATP synthase F1 subunit delta [Betaproteobacteria bacterium]
MTNRTAANRYARALLDVAVAEKTDVQRVEAQLAEFGDLFRQYPALEKVLLNPAVPVPRKRAAVADIAARGGMLPVVAKLLVLLAERDRLVLLPDLVVAYRERLLDHLKVVRAEVTTAVPLGEDRSLAVERSLAALTGRTVTLASKVDPAIIGGVVAQIGSTIYDGSVARQLEKIRERLAGGQTSAQE